MAKGKKQAHGHSHGDSAEQQHGHSHNEDNSRDVTHKSDHHHSHSPKAEHEVMKTHIHNHSHNGDHSDHNHSHSPQQQYGTYQSSALAIPSPSPTPLQHIVCSHTVADDDCGHTECLTDDDKKRMNSQQVLKIVTLLCATFMMVELVGGYFSGSLAIMTDAAHLLSDLISFLISLLSITWATKKPNNQMTFGYHRVEILGAIISVFMIWSLTVVLVYESIHRIINPDLIQVNGKMMLGVAVIGFLVNIAMGTVLLVSGGEHGHSHGGLPGAHGHSHGGADHADHSDDEDHHGHSHGETSSLLHKSHHDEKHIEEEEGNFITRPLARFIELILPTDASHRSINVQAAILHVLGDLMQSVGVIFAALIIIVKPSWKLADPFCTLLFSVIVLTTTMRVMKQGLTVLMEGVPDGIDSEDVAKSLQQIPHVVMVHDLHIWSLSVNSPALAVHLVVVSDETNANSVHADVVRNANKVLEKKYKITHTTIQIEGQYEMCLPKTVQCKRQNSFGSGLASPVDSLA